jgi:hypothetical protein
LSPQKSLNENVLLDVLKLNSIAGLELAKICSQKSVLQAKQKDLFLYHRFMGVPVLQCQNQLCTE